MKVLNKMDPAGLWKRLVFAKEVLSEVCPRRVLDIGCGTGVYLTYPLACAFPEVQFHGVDSDIASITRARKEFTVPNLRYDTELPEGQSFELVIASEVIEHVEEPEAFLATLKRWLTPGGKIFLTLPNGYGVSEVISCMFALLYVTGVYSGLRKFYTTVLGKPQVKANTLSPSPHINFFSFSDIHNVFARTGLHVSKYRPRAIVSGFGFSQIIRGPLIRYNAELADHLSPRLVCDWMFLLEPTDVRTAPRYHRGAVAQFRRYMNEKRAGLR